MFGLAFQNAKVVVWINIYLWPGTVELWGRSAADEMIKGCGSQNA
jgi:hypothetical protein